MAGGSVSSSQRETKEQLVERIIAWMREYNSQVLPGPIRLSVINRVFGKQCRNLFGMGLNALMVESGRFGTMMNKNGARIVSIRSADADEQIRRARALWDEDDAERAAAEASDLSKL